MEDSFFWLRFQHARRRFQVCSSTISVYVPECKFAVTLYIQLLLLTKKHTFWLSGRHLRITWQPFTFVNRQYCTMYSVCLDIMESEKTQVLRQSGEEMSKFPEKVVITVTFTLRAWFFGPALNIGSSFPLWSPALPSGNLPWPSSSLPFLSGRSELEDRAVSFFVKEKLLGFVWVLVAGPSRLQALISDKKKSLRGTTSLTLLERGDEGVHAGAVDFWLCGLIRVKSIKHLRQLVQ